MVIWFVISTLMGCTTTLPVRPESISSNVPIVVGRAVTVLLGPTTRWFTPELRFFEVINTVTNARIRVDVESDDAWFVLPLPAGQYELSRIQISEGALMGMAGLNPRFDVSEDNITYVGTWRIGVESPQYDRSVLVSAVSEPDPAIQNTLTSYPILEGRSFVTNLLNPSTTEVRLYEVPPYPRAWFFRRHHTS